MKKFNMTGFCTPEEDYMVDISGKTSEIRELIDNRYYFTINRARQYGKTTTLAMLGQTLKNEYICVEIDFEGLGKTPFSDEDKFCNEFKNMVGKALENTSLEREAIAQWNESRATTFSELSECITALCRERKIVLMIDEVDKASNYEIFLYFLGMLRKKFHERKRRVGATFHSVILTGVYDIKNIKAKQVKAAVIVLNPDEDRESSPWNIAEDFDVDMSFSPTEIATMLNEYEADHTTGMDVSAISEEIHSYTDGYPFLVSSICRYIDEKLAKEWTIEGVQKAVKFIVSKANTLFGDVFKNLRNDTELHDYIYGLLIKGTMPPFVIHDPIVAAGVRYGYFKDVAGNVSISNKIFELAMTEYFISKDLRNKKQVTGVLSDDVIKDGRFDMELCLRKFAEHYAEIYNDKDAAFLEKHGRLLFISYLKPLINGEGFYHIESQFTDLRRMDVVVDYGRDQYIIELKIWRGEQKEREAYEQLCGYLNTKRADTGYLVTFDFRKEANKERRAEWVEVDGKKIFDVII